ncbi:murein L,D-transpeptidase family protein [Hyphomicrobium sp. 99]|uniref:L,D-transpeptidase family protein n=1 Tax=Hyphomicrobium sp. 99 TaxID=1163419 RepID=UPI0012E0A5C8|nr:murein L,D-transpeptidase family protein [Hyphomicrobium sp. 99]
MGTNTGSMTRAVVRLMILFAVAALAACSSAPTIPPPSEVPLSKETLGLLAKKGMQAGSPVFVRIFKEESELEVWKQRDDGRFYHFRTYPICNWSGAIGPKQSTGDRQAPEGFYSITPTLMNPNSKYYLSFNLGYPNAFDRSWGRTGDSVMVHGSCRSAGCYAMTDALMEEIYGLTREALKAGQPSFQLHAYPFRMTDARMAREKSNQWYGFWKTMKQGYDYFEKYRIPPSVAVCERRYVVDAVPRSRPDASGRCPAFDRPFVTAFTPLPEPAQMDVASGNKLKGITNPDNEPSLADIKVAKQQQSQSSMAASSPISNAN